MLLFLCVGPPENDAHIQRLPLEDLDWDLVGAWALHNKTVLPLWARLKKVGDDRVPPQVRGRLQQLAMVAEFRQTHLENRLLQVLDLLAREEIDAILLKGGALAVSAYGGFGVREMGDLDLLLSAERAWEAQERLRASGWKPEYPDDHEEGRKAFYEAHHHLPGLLDPAGSGTALELHSDLFLPGHPFDVVTAHIRDSTTQVTFRNRQIRIPTPAGHTVYLCLHFAWSHMLRVGTCRTFSDIQVLTSQPDFEWPTFQRLAKESGGEAACFWTLALAAELARVSIPAEVLRALQPQQPLFAQRLLKRHLMQELLPSATACPSESLRRALWTFALRPGPSGHGAVRPWVHSADSNPPAWAGQNGGIRKLQRHWTRLQSWRRYVGTVWRRSAPPVLAQPR